MSSRYTVVQYVPDPVAEERINVGVIAYSETDVCAQFLTDWKRVRSFGGEDTKFLREFARAIQGAVAARTHGGAEETRAEALTPDAIEKMAAKWTNSIQFTSPRASLKSAEMLLREAVQRFLSERVQAVEKRRDRQQAANITTSRVRSAVKSLVGEIAETLTKPRHALWGDRQEHVYDVAVANGVPYLAAQALSLEGTESKQLHTQLDAIAWMIDDTRAQFANLPLAVVMLPPRPTSPNFDALDRIRQERAEIYEDLGARVLTDENVEAWALATLAESLPRQGT